MLISILIAAVLIIGAPFVAPYLPYNELFGGTVYQVVATCVAIVVSYWASLPMLYMFRGNSAYNKGKYKDAVALYKKAYKTNRLSPDMEIYCGYILLKEGERDFAENVFKKLETKKLNFRQQNTFDVNRAILIWKKGDIDSAIDLLKKVWAKEESVTVAGTLGALMLVKARESLDYTEALGFCEKTNEKFTYERTILANLGEAYFQTGKNDEALKVFGELMDCGSKAPAACYYYALALMKDGQRDEAEEMLNRSLRQRFSALSTVSKKTVKAMLEEITIEE